MAIEPQRVTARLRIRDAASLDGIRIGVLEVGTVITPVAELAGATVAGNARWFQLPDQGFVWSGGCTPTGEHDPASPAQKVPQRSDGTLMTLGVDEIKAIYGDFSYSEAGHGDIKIAPPWTEQNIVEVAIPRLVELGWAKLPVHRKAAAPLQRVFAQIKTFNLDWTIRSCAGCFVPRHKGHDPARTLSAHSWGIAIDLNAQWNGYGQQPAALGAVGSVRDLIGVFQNEGFAWGGYFQPDAFRDGMHFELARRDL